MKTQSLATILAFSLSLSFATGANGEDLLIKIAKPVNVERGVSYFSQQGLFSEAITDEWIHVQGNTENINFSRFIQSGSIVHVQKNYKIKLRENFSMKQQIAEYLAQNPEAAIQPFGPIAPDNPSIPAAPPTTTGADPLFGSQWGMKDIGVERAWSLNRGNDRVIVAVIDTGVDYTHEDLLPNMWRNAKEIPNNNIDDDNNGYVDDIVGWDFLDKDNKPYDLATNNLGDLFNGGNPGHGTHCAGNVAAKGNNGKGISGVAPNAKIMALRFIGNKGGTTADAVKAIRYAVDNGAKVLSNSWGSEGEDPADAANNQALKDAITYAGSKDTLFIAAAGNGHQGAGYNNDTDSKPAYPASYPHENIISVAAIDVNNQFGGFSNWGVKSVDIAAPGVKVFSTTVGGKYSDTVIPMMGANWDGTSMACPHVAGAAALYWSVHPEKSALDVKTAILNSAVKFAAGNGKLVTGGKLNVENLMRP